MPEVVSELFSCCSKRWSRSDARSPENERTVFNATIELAGKGDGPIVRHLVASLYDWKLGMKHGVVERSNSEKSATRSTRSVDCNRSAMAGFAAAHGFRRRL